MRANVRRGTTLTFALTYGTTRPCWPVEVAGVEVGVLGGVEGGRSAAPDLPVRGPESLRARRDKESFLDSLKNKSHKYRKGVF